MGGSHVLAVDNNRLEINKDFTVIFRDNIEAGTATAIIQGSGEFSGTVEKTFPIHHRVPTITLKNKQTTCTGSEVTIDEAIVVGVENGPEPSGAITYTYYTDEQCTVETTPESSKSSTIGGAPAKAGTYYVIAHIAKAGNYDEANSNVATLILDKRRLILGVDYTVRYENNINAGTASAIIQGSGEYSGTIVKTFPIHKATPVVTLEDKTASYTGNPIKIGAATVTGVPNGTRPDGFFHYTYYIDDECVEQTTTGNSGALASGTEPVNTGKYYVDATFHAEESGNYTDASKTAKLTIEKKNSDAIITGNDLTYNGNMQELVTVSNANGEIFFSTKKALTSSNYSTEGSMSIPKERDAGFYTVYYYIRGNDNYAELSGSVRAAIHKATPVLFITPTELSVLEGAIETITASYTGDGKLRATSSNPGIVSVSVDGTIIKVTGKKVGQATVGVSLLEGTNHTEVGPVTCAVEVVEQKNLQVKIKLSDKESGVRAYALNSSEAEASNWKYLEQPQKETIVVAEYFTDRENIIWAKDEAGNVSKKKIEQEIINMDPSLIQITLGQSSMEYNGTALKPAVSVKYKGTLLKINEEYRVEYSNNVNVGTGTVRIIGVRRYQGEKSQNFTITPATPTITLKAGRYYENGSPRAIEPAQVTGTSAGTAPDGNVSYVYYTNSALTSQTSTSQGATQTGGAPANAGDYYVQASITAHGNYTEASSNVVKLTIERAPVRVNLATVGGSVSPLRITTYYRGTYGENTSLPTPTKQGYTFNGWHTSRDSSGTLVVDSTVVERSDEHSLYAWWTPNTNTPYVVNHCIDQSGNGNYEIVNTEDKTGTTGATITLANEKKNFPGYQYQGGALQFTPNNMNMYATKIAPDGSTTIYLFYTRN